MTVDPCDAGPRGSGDDMRFFCTTLSASLFLLISAGPASPAELGEVDANVLVAVDVSGSIDGETQRLQLEGLAETLVHPAFVNAVERGPVGSIGFAVFTWSSQDDFVLVVPWRRIGTAADCEDVALRLSTLRLADRFAHHSYATPARPRRTSLDTDVSVAIEVAAGFLEDAPFTSGRRLLNIHANGVDNVGEAPDRARDAAVAVGITINGMILHDQPEVADYFRLHVQGGPGAFVMTVRDRSDMVATMLAKFVLELAHDRWLPSSPRSARALALIEGF